MRRCYFVTLQSFIYRGALNAASNTVNEIIITVELNFIINLSHASQEHTPTRIQLFLFSDKPVPRKGELFTINFTETVKAAQEKFTLL